MANELQIGTQREPVVQVHAVIQLGIVFGVLQRRESRVVNVVDRCRLILCSRIMAVGRIDVKAGDGNADVPTVQAVIKLLQERDINRFNLITDLENKPVAAAR